MPYIFLMIFGLSVATYAGASSTTEGGASIVRDDTSKGKSGEATESSSTINGINNQEILGLIERQISDWNEVSEESISRDFKVKKDKLSIKRILNSYGYFDAKVDVSDNNGKMVFNVKLNKRYRFDDVLLIYVDQRKYRSGLTIGQVFDLIDIGYNSYTDTKQISAGRENIEKFLRGKGFAFVNVKSPKIETNKKEKTLKATYKIILNGKTIIDKTIINIKSKKDPRLLEPFVRNRIDWNDGDVYNPQKIEDLKTFLKSSGLFSKIDVRLGEPAINLGSKESHTVVTIDLEEALLRDIAVGLSYGTSEKFGILFSWTHYNIDGKGSSLSFKSNWSKDTKYLKLNHSLYDPLYRKQKLSSHVAFCGENVSSYDVDKLEAGSILWQTFGTKVNLGGGLCAEKSRTKDKIDKEITRFRAIGVPIELSFDTTSDYIDPQKGIRCSSYATPYFGNLTNFTIFSGRASVYFPIRKNSFKNRAVLAIYSKFGSIFRNKNHKVPRDKFFFSGGANSIRGYGYQKLGPVNDDKKPLGGESVFEFGIEPRIKLSDNVGLVTFLEGGNVYKSKVPHPWKDMLFGYGVGVRYYTPLGPIRLDIALPSKIRKTSKGKRVDSPFNIYISVGQAF